MTKTAHTYVEAIPQSRVRMRTTVYWQPQPGGILYQVLVGEAVVWSRKLRLTLKNLRRIQRRLTAHEQEQVAEEWAHKEARS